MVERLGEMRKGEERGLRNVAERIIQKERQNDNLKRRRA